MSIKTENRNYTGWISLASILLLVGSVVVAVNGEGFAGSRTAQVMGCLSVLGFAAGFFMAPAKVQSEDSVIVFMAGSGVGGAMLLIGFFGFIVGRFME